MEAYKRAYAVVQLLLDKYPLLFPDEPSGAPNAVNAAVNSPGMCMCECNFVL